LPFDADRIPISRLGPHGVLEENIVPPRVPEVVLVLEPEALAGPGQDVADPRAGRILVAELVEVLVQQQRVAVKLLTDLEVMQVGVGPAHRRLDALVQLIEGAILDLDAPPNGRTTVLEGKLELVNSLRGRNRPDAL